MTQEQIDNERREMERRYNELMATARGMRLRAEKCSTVREAMQCVRAADEFTARAYHLVA